VDQAANDFVDYLLAEGEEGDSSTGDSGDEVDSQAPLANPSSRGGHRGGATVSARGGTVRMTGPGAATGVGRGGVITMAPPRGRGGGLLPGRGGRGLPTLAVPVQDDDGDDDDDDDDDDIVVQDGSGGGA
jgi:hypothetical protein